MEIVKNSINLEYFKICPANYRVYSRNLLGGGDPIV